MSPSRFFGSFGSVRRFAVLALVALSPLVVPAVSRSQFAAPGDVYWDVHLDQVYQYYAFVQDQIVWENTDLADVSLAYSAVHDTSDALGVVHLSTEFTADAGRFVADLETGADLSARTGVYHRLLNRLDLRVWIRGGAGTSYWITNGAFGQIEAWRHGGLPGWAAPVNGWSTTDLFGGSVYVDYEGAETSPVDASTTLSGFTTTEILVGSETYSLAAHLIYYEQSEVGQAVCILGCMTEAATFHALGDGQVEVNVYPYAPPTDVPLSISAPIELSVSPNPLRDATAVTFQAPAGRAASVRIYDVAGRLRTRLFDARATGGPQTVRWETVDAPAGVYFVRIDAGDASSTRKITLLR
ncbi:MAG: T9SS type A sorting domain-containing protein [bacterium]